jgi:hypothetical protein
MWKNIWWSQKKLLPLGSNKKIGMKKYELTLKREEMVKAGAYDGRFREKTVVDKKKKEKKEWARQKFSFNFKNSK